eukprot:6398116-Alexandrium_andersonii.AAC.1
MISRAAISRPFLNEDARKYARPGQRALMRAKAQAIVGAVLESECDVAVLSAFGCGANANPPEEVAQFFWEA